ncbi:hypothetical protein AK830_g2291 [Neonectria ditissima]|uniref:Heterokaryon incompatibility domain-containing protein n=1 Tax=Neonectria ditissima TaxID=78410 RepID=A0A0P7B3M0_9HYPO|nr:hypothetical protein AK830_g2291 [Neonectria ditissima]
MADSTNRNAFNHEAIADCFSSMPHPIGTAEASSWAYLTRASPLSIPPLLYKRLPEDRIRLHKLRPGHWDDDLEAELFEADQSFRYIALSYTWGSSLALKEVLVDGTVKGIIINLDLALRTIRSPDVPLTLWVDSLCINQDDVDDKSQQVNLMHHIFSWAIEVRAYVGDSLDRSQANYHSRLRKLAAASAFQFPEDHDAAWSHIHGVFSKLELQGQAHLTPHERCLCMFGLLRALSSQHLHSKLHDMPLFSDNEPERMEPKLRFLFERIRAFVVAPWWDRMWVTQEVGVAHDLQLTYGKITIPFQVLSNIVDELEARPFKLSPHGISELRRLQQYESVTQTRDSDYFQRSLGSPLLWLLRTFRHRHSSEPRDKVYALSQLLGNLGTSSQNTITPNYATPVADLFCSVVTRIIHETGIFWITSADLATKSRDNLPSWVPNWADGFTPPDPNNIAWKIRLCHNASKLSFTVWNPDSDTQSMSPSEYYHKLAEDTASAWKRLEGASYKHAEEFPHSLDPVHKSYAYSKCIHLDYENTESRRIYYEYHDPPTRQFTKVENFLKVPAQYCTKIRHVSEPIAPDLSNLSKIMHNLQDNDSEPGFWGHGMLEEQLDAVGRVICFGVIMKQNREVRAQGAWDHSNLANFIRLLTYHLSEDYSLLYREKFAMEIMSHCAHCSVSIDLPCQDCRDKVMAIPTPSRSEAWNDESIQEVHHTALQTAPGSCILLTYEGRLALGPPQTRPDDWICILSGGLCPYILRRDESRKYLDNRSFNLIGDCYLDGAPDWNTDRLETIALV